MLIYLGTWDRSYSKGKLNFDKFFLELNVNKKYMQRVTLEEQSQSDCKHWILDTHISIFKWV